jgi:hypothetical protein
VEKGLVKMHNFSLGDSRRRRDLAHRKPEYLYIPLGVKRRLETPGKTEPELIEVQ